MYTRTRCSPWDQISLRSRNTWYPHTVLMSHWWSWIMNIFFQWTVCETPGFTVKGAELQTTLVLHKDETISSKQWVTWLRQNICEAELRVGFEEHLLLRSPQAQSCRIFVPVLCLFLTEPVSQRCICNTENEGQRSKVMAQAELTRHSSNVFLPKT